MTVGVSGFQHCTTFSAPATLHPSVRHGVGTWASAWALLTTSNGCLELVSVHTCHTAYVCMCIQDM